jgi:hypothetical protein
MRVFPMPFLAYRSWPPPFPIQLPVPPAPPRASPVENNLGRIANEHLRVQSRVEGFDWRLSHAWRYLAFVYGEKVTQGELVSIADLLARSIGIRLDRDARRRKVVMIKWFEEHWAIILPFLRVVALVKSD